MMMRARLNSAAEHDDSRCLRACARIGDSIAGANCKVVTATGAGLTAGAGCSATGLEGAGAGAGLRCAFSAALNACSVTIGARG